MTLQRHKGPVFSLKWNRTGSMLLSGSVDKTAIVWDCKTGDVIQQFTLFVTKARGFHRCCFDDSAGYVQNKSCKSFALDVFRYDEERSLLLHADF